jgi:hypothetical protein
MTDGPLPLNKCKDCAKWINKKCLKNCSGGGAQL